IQHDDHLAHEAQNYQKFDDILFEHWTGYNVVPPLHDPTPVGAVVPQFYGYYEAVDEKGKKIKADKRGRYLSPILLLEDCGKPIVVENLSIDDRQECAALLYRLHYAGWTHNSFYRRNILMQLGDISDWPITRMNKSKPDRRFRLIDFGRA
ncbi:uncharacterized protein STEHIDRAFT_41053, partial [Stereum hirsutum FP-91666 SS1]|uniref:uncharacterized protein n=1 Tax=Stereum hirsutum (strain FP-91666) TaxID=721885 RepID=UPI000440B76E